MCMYEYSFQRNACQERPSDSSRHSHRCSQWGGKNRYFCQVILYRRKRLYSIQVLSTGEHTKYGSIEYSAKVINFNLFAICTT